MAQITMISKTVTENTLDVPKLQTHLELLILKVQDKYESSKEEYSKIVTKEDFEQTEDLFSQLDDYI